MNHFVALCRLNWRTVLILSCMVGTLSGCTASDPTKGTSQDLEQLRMSPAERTKMVEQMRARAKNNSSAPPPASAK